MYREWSNQQCDQVLETSIEQQSKSELTIRTSNTVAPRQNSMIAAAAAQSFGDGVGSSTTTNVGQFDMHHTKEKETGLLHKLENDRKNRVKGDTAGLPRISKKSIGQLSFLINKTLLVQTRQSKSFLLITILLNFSFALKY